MSSQDSDTDLKTLVKGPARPETHYSGTAPGAQAFPSAGPEAAGHTAASDHQHGVNRPNQRPPAEHNPGLRDVPNDLFSGFQARLGDQMERMRAQVAASVGTEREAAVSARMQSLMQSLEIQMNQLGGRLNVEGSDEDEGIDITVTNPSPSSHHSSGSN